MPVKLLATLKFQLCPLPVIRSKQAQMCSERSTLGIVRPTAQELQTQSALAINMMCSRQGGLTVPMHAQNDWVFPEMSGLLNMSKSENTQLVSGKKYCKITQQSMKSLHRQQEKLVTSNKSRECNWTGGRIDVSVANFPPSYRCRLNLLLTKQKCNNQQSNRLLFPYNCAL